MKRFLLSFLLSCLVNICLLLLLFYLGKTTEVKVYQTYKIDVIEILLPKPEPPKEEPKPEIKPQRRESPPKEEPQAIPLPIQEERGQQEEEAIPILQEEKEEVSHLILPPSQEGPQQPGIVDIEGLDHPLRMISYEKPRYPKAARIREVEGVVRLKLLVNPKGMIEKAEVLEEDPKGFGFGRSSLEATKTFRLTPPKARGEGVYVWYILPIRFSLEE
ncbi:TPA: hypothetical protein DCX15_03035 [bacterium]|nr:hypothetical protein [bacterium]